MLSISVDILWIKLLKRSGWQTLKWNTTQLISPYILNIFQTSDIYVFIKSVLILLIELMEMRRQ